MPVLIIVLLAIVVLFVVGGVLIGFVLKLLWWALVGLAIGALARLVLPGRQRMGWLATILYGVAGALLGGIVADLLDLGSVLELIVAVLAAAGLIALLRGRRIGI